MNAVSDWKSRFSKALSGAQKGLETVADGAIKAADKARKVASIEIGTITVQTLGSPRMGGTLRGKVVLDLDEPIDAKRVTLCLKATQARQTLQRSEGRTAPVKTTHTLHDYTEELSGERSYHQESLNFAFDIPELSDAEVEIDGALGDALRFAQGVRKLTSSPITWQLVAKLEIPWARNLRKAIDVSVR